MNRSRQALTLSILYALPLLIWLTTQLEFVEWSTGSLHTIFKQSLAGLMLLQAAAMTLLLINNPTGKWLEDFLGVMHILLFPLPFLTLIWLTGSASLIVILKGLLLICSIAVVSLLIQQGGRIIPARQNTSQIVPTLAHSILITILWNFRDRWWSWLQ